MGEYAALASTALNAANTFSGQRREADAVERQGAYEKSQYDFNATLAARQAADAVDRGTIAASREREQTRATIAAGRASAAAAGVDVSYGSALDVAHNTAQMGELDALTIENNAAREAWGYKVQQEDYTSKGRMALFAGQQKAAGYRAASISTLLTGAAQTYGLYAEQHPKQPRIGKTSTGGD